MGALWPGSYEEAVVRLVIAGLIIWLGGTFTIWIGRHFWQPPEEPLAARVDLHPEPTSTLYLTIPDADGVVESYEVPIVPGREPRTGR